MSEPIPESIPTSTSRRPNQNQPNKRPRHDNNTQASQIDALFANPERTITTTAPTQRSALLPPEIVANVQGSSAGAGSGEFHVYKASRRREYERLRVMDEENEREVQDREFEAKREERRKEDEGKLSKNRERRAKAKARKEKVKIIKGMEGMDVDGSGGAAGANVRGDGGGGLKKKLGAAKIANVGERLVGGDAEGEVGTNGNGVAAEEEGGITFHDDD